MLQMLRPGLTMDLRDDLARMAGAPPQGAAQIAGLVDSFMMLHLNSLMRDTKLPPIPPLGDLPELSEVQKGPRQSPSPPAHS